MFLVMQTYRIRDEFREDYLKAIEVIVQSAMDLGCVSFQVWENDDRRNEFTEMMGFDSWSHYERLRAVPPVPRVAEIAERMDGWIEGGANGIQVTHWNAVIE